MSEMDKGVHRHDHHEHAHGPECGCSACAEEAGGHKKLEVSSHIQDSAVVVSAEYHVTADSGKINRLLTEHMEALAARIDSLGGIIGHIKASAEIRHVEMYSLTDRIVMRKEAELPDITLHMAAIVFAVEEEELLCIIRNMFEDMDRKLQ